MPRGNPVDGVGIVRYPDAVPGQLVPESYRPRTGGRRGRGQRRHAPLQLLRAADERLPGSLAALAVERREDLAAPGVGDGEALAPDPGLRHPQPDRVERADACGRRAEGGAEPARRRDPDPQPRERARAEPDAEQVDLPPAARRRSAALDLLEQGGRVLRPPFGGGAEQGLGEDLAVAPGTGGGVLGRGVEADDDQRVAPRP
jgi:hypothetical protein